MTTPAFQINAFQPNAFQTLVVTGVLNATDENDTGAFVGDVQVSPLLTLDMHDGDKKRQKKLSEKLRKEAQKKKEQRDYLIDIFERVVEGKKDDPIIEEIVSDYEKIDTISNLKSIDFDALMQDLARVQQIYDAYIELDDEEVLVLL